MRLRGSAPVPAVCAGWARCGLGFPGRQRLLPSTCSPVSVYRVCVPCCAVPRACFVPGLSTGASVCLLRLCPLVCPVCVCVSVRLCSEALVSSRRGESAGEKGNTRARSKGFVVFKCACVYSPQRGSGPPSHGAVARRQPKLSDILLVVLDSVSLPHFPSFPPFFSQLLLSPRQGQGPGGTGRLVVVAPAAPGAQSHRLPGGLTAMEPRFGYFQQPRPFDTGENFGKGERVCLGSASCLSLTFRSHGRAGGSRGLPVRRDPPARSFPFLSEAVCLR